MSLGVMGSSAGAAGSNCVVGTYSGTGSNVTLTFDAPVKAFIVNGKFNVSMASYLGTGVWIYGTGLKYGGYDTNYGAFQESSFSPTVNGNTITVPNFIVSGQTYKYIAFF